MQHLNGYGKPLPNLKSILHFPPSLYHAAAFSASQFGHWEHYPDGSVAEPRPSEIWFVALCNLKICLPVGAFSWITSNWAWHVVQHFTPRAVQLRKVVRLWPCQRCQCMQWGCTGFQLRQVQLSRIRPNPAPAKVWARFLDFTGFHFPHNGCGAEMLIFWKYNQSSLELGLKSEELNDDCDISYSTFSTFCLLFCFCYWQISKCQCSQLSLIWFYATTLHLQSTVSNLASALAGFGKLESGASVVYTHTWE